MTLRELALELHSRVTFIGKLHVRDATFENPWLCQLDDIGFESSGWSGMQFVTYTGGGKTTAQAWEKLTQNLRGKTVRIRRGPDNWKETFAVPADLVAGDAP